MALMVIASLGGDLYCALNRPIEGTAMPSRISAGTTVQITSISVLWLVFEGTGLERLLYLRMTQTNRASTNRLMMTMIQTSPM